MIKDYIAYCIVQFHIHVHQIKNSIQLFYH